MLLTHAPASLLLALIARTIQVASRVLFVHLAKATRSYVSTREPKAPSYFCMLVRSCWLHLQELNKNTYGPWQQHVGLVNQCRKMEKDNNMCKDATFSGTAPCHT